MRAVKLLLLAVLVVGWWQIWQHRDDVASAYTEDRAPLALELNGVGALPEEAESSVSPYALLAPGTGRAPTFVVSSAEPAEATSVELTGGSVSIDGTVELLDGTPVAGATVRIERFTSDGSAFGETATGPDGTWQATGLRAGRLRIRAYAPNALASVESVVVVLSTSGRATVPLQVQSAAATVRFDVAGPLGIAVGAQGTIAIVASRETVDESGRLVQFPLAGQPLTASFSVPARLLSADVVTTDSGGAARYLLVCDGEGVAVGRLELDAERPTVTLPPCLTAEALAEVEAAAAAEEADRATSATADEAEALVEP